MINFLDQEDILLIHHNQIELYGGQAGIRDQALLESAISQPQITFGEEFLHKDIYEMAAAYLFHLVQDHPFIDGNKRTGIMTAMIFLDFHQIELNCTNDELEEMVLNLAAGKVSKSEAALFFEKHSLSK
jgi:death-on-curing protein